MTFTEIGRIGYGMAAVIYALLLAMLLIRWRQGGRTWILATPLVTSAAWSAIYAFSGEVVARAASSQFLVEVVRFAAWLGVLLVVITSLESEHKARQLYGRIGAAAIVLVGSVSGWVSFKSVPAWRWRPRLFSWPSSSTGFIRLRRSVRHEIS